MTLPEETQALIDEIQAECDRVRVAARERRDREIVQELDSGVGRVVVNGVGTFQSVQLDRNALLVASEDVLARQIVDALAKAEKKAAQNGDTQ